MESVDTSKMETIYSVNTDGANNHPYPLVQPTSTAHTKKSTNRHSAIATQPSNEEIDELCVNLKILSNMPINTRLSTTGIFLNHEVSTYYIPISVKRWWGGDSRDETIRKLERIVNRTILFSEVTDLDSTRYKLVDLLTKSIAGIKNIRETYATCVQTSARIDTIIAKIEARTDAGIGMEYGSNDIKIE